MVVSRKKKIAHVSTPWYDIPTKKYGGVEKTLFELINAQSSKYEVSLYAPADVSVMQGAFVSSLFKKGIADMGFDRTIEVAQALYAVKEIIKQQYDIIHVHNLYPMLAFAEIVNLPMVFTYHSVLKPDVKVMNSICDSGNIFSCFLSNAHRVEYNHLENARVIYYGLNVDNFPHFSQKQKSDYFAFVGSISEEKGIAEAIKVAKATGKKLKIAGKIKPQNMNYFENEIKPMIRNNSNIEFLGEIDDYNRNLLIGKSQALLFPIKWNEPFGRILIESLAVGTPVIAFNRGSVPEIINKNVGIIVESLEEMTNEVAKFSGMDPYQCRAHVANNFSIEKMVSEYDKVYNEILINKK